jgi:hypothetical protein
MKTLVSVLAVAVALALTGPAFAAGDVTKAKTAAECAKAGGIWNAATNICTRSGNARPWATLRAAAGQRHAASVAHRPLPGVGRTVDLTQCLCSVSDLPGMSVGTMVAVAG